MTRAQQQEELGKTILSKRKVGGPTPWSRKELAMFDGAEKNPDG